MEVDLWLLVYIKLKLVLERGLTRGTCPVNLQFCSGCRPINDYFMFWLNAVFSDSLLVLEQSMVKKQLTNSELAACGEWNGWEATSEKKVWDVLGSRCFAIQYIWIHNEQAWQWARVFVSFDSLITTYMYTNAMLAFFLSNFSNTVMSFKAMLMYPFKSMSCCLKSVTQTLYFLWRMFIWKQNSQFLCSIECILPRGGIGCLH